MQTPLLAGNDSTTEPLAAASHANNGGIGPARGSLVDMHRHNMQKRRSTQSSAQAHARASTASAASVHSTHSQHTHEHTQPSASSSSSANQVELTHRAAAGSGGSAGYSRRPSNSSSRSRIGSNLERMPDDAGQDLDLLLEVDDDVDDPRYDVHKREVIDVRRPVEYDAEREESASQLNVLRQWAEEDFVSRDRELSVVFRDYHHSSDSKHKHTDLQPYHTPSSHTNKFVVENAPVYVRSTCFLVWFFGIATPLSSPSKVWSYVWSPITCFFVSINLWASILNARVSGPRHWRGYIVELVAAIAFVFYWREGRRWWRKLYVQDVMLKPEYVARQEFRLLRWYRVTHSFVPVFLLVHMYFDIHSIVQGYSHPAPKQYLPYNLQAFEQVWGIFFLAPFLQALLVYVNVLQLVRYQIFACRNDFARRYQTIAEARVGLQNLFTDIHIVVAQFRWFLWVVNAVAFVDVTFLLTVLATADSYGDFSRKYTGTGGGGATYIFFVVYKLAFAAIANVMGAAVTEAARKLLPCISAKFTSVDGLQLITHLQLLETKRDIFPRLLGFVLDYKLCLKVGYLFLAAAYVCIQASAKF